MPRLPVAVFLAAAFAAAPSLAQEQPLKGEFRPLNPKYAGRTVSGTVTIRPEDGNLVIEVSAQGLSPGMHLAHLHGFVNPQAATCPTSAVDANRDGVLDLIETQASSGVTMIPLTDRPESLEIQSRAYPQADGEGRLHYRQAVNRSALEQAVRDRFGTQLSIGSRVVFLHGGPEGTPLPDSVKSLEGVPAHATLPAACAELTAVLER